MTTLTMPRRLMSPVASRPARRSLAVGLLTGLAAGVLLLIGTSLAVGIITAGTIMPGVRVAGLDVSGLDRTSSAALLEAQLPSLSTGRVTIVVDEIEQQIPYADLGRGYEYEAMVDAALDVARTGGPLVEGIDRLRALVRATSIPVMVHGYDEAALDRVVATLAERVEIMPVDATVSYEDGRFTVSPADDGRRLDAEAIRGALAVPLASADPADVHLTLEAAVVVPDVTTDDARSASTDAGRTARPLTLTIPGAPDEEEPDPALALTTDTIAGWISFGKTQDSAYGVIVDEKPLAAVMEALVVVVDREPANAGFEVVGTGLGGVIPGQDGRVLNVDESVEALLGALEDRIGGASRSSVALDVTVEEPALSTAEAEAALPQMELVSSWTTNYVPGISNGWGANISIPARDIDGTTVAPGDWFSFWGGIGPITTARGYTYGGAIINGRTEPTGALAGGICSTSTTLFNAAMRFGLEIGERDNHYYYIDRYPLGLDATVFLSDGYTQDMTFRNDTDNPVVVRGFGSPGRVTFQLWSVPNGRTVALSDAYITNRRGAVDTTREDPSMAAGTSRRIESPHAGFDATVSRTVTDADGDVLHRNTWFSDYRPVNGVVLTGPAAPAAVPPPGAEGTSGGGDVADEPPGDPQP